MPLFVPAISGAPIKLVFTDDFNRADSTNLNASWTEFNSPGSHNSLLVDTNALRVTGASGLPGLATARWGVPALTDDQFSEVTVGSQRNGTIRLYLRMHSSGVPMLWLDVSCINGDWAFVTHDSTASSRSSGTVRASGTTTAPATGAQIRAECPGSLYQFKVDGSVVGSFTDGSAVHPTGSDYRTVGVGLTCPPSSGGMNVDNWFGGDL